MSSHGNDAHLVELEFFVLQLGCIVEGELASYGQIEYIVDVVVSIKVCLSFERGLDVVRQHLIDCGVKVREDLEREFGRDS